MADRMDVYLNFNGNASAVALLYGKVFDKNVEIMKFKEFPTFAEMEGVNPDWIGHAEISFDNSNLMFSDGPGMKMVQGNNFSLSWATDNKEIFSKVWNNFVREGANVKEEPMKTFFASLYGRLEDPFGISWLLLYNDQNERM